MDKERVIEAPKKINNEFAKEELKAETSKEVKEATESLVETDDLDDILMGEAIMYSAISK